MRVRMIWDRAPHSASADLARYQDAWYCAFREGAGQLSDDGRLRVIRSSDGRNWESVALLEWEDADLRDPRLAITPAGQLVLNGAVRWPAPGGDDRHQSVSWLSADGRAWGAPQVCPDQVGTWRWGVSWQGSTGYSFGYGRGDAGGTLYRTPDGQHWEPVAREVFPPGRAVAASLAFLEGGRAYCLLCREPHTCFPAVAALGLADPPYQRWTWIDLQLRMGAPRLVHLPAEERLVATVRLYHPVRTALCEIEPLSCRLTRVGAPADTSWRAVEIVPLPSAGDTGYAGMVARDGHLFISYHSSHQVQTRVFLAVMVVPYPPPL